MAFQIVLLDSEAERQHLYPLVFTRPVADLRVGALTIREKWERIFQVPIYFQTADYLSEKYPPTKDLDCETLLIRSYVLPDIDLVGQLRALRPGQVLVDKNEDWLAVRISAFSHFDTSEIHSYDSILLDSKPSKLVFPEHVFLYNAEQIVFDIAYCLKPTKTGLSSTNTVIGQEIYAEDGVQCEYMTLDATNGPIYLGKGALVETGVIIKGPVAIGEGARVKAGTVLYPNVTVGKNSTVCGEINNTVIWGNSAKSHAGYLGCAVLGEGVNLGAGTSNSNLKNDWSTVKLYDYNSDVWRDTGLLKCGVIIGDHSMLGIQSKINTGSVIGVGTQIAFSKFIPKFVPDFVWLTDDIYESYIFDRFLKMMDRRGELTGKMCSAHDKSIFAYIFEKTKALRSK